MICWLIFRMGKKGRNSGSSPSSSSSLTKSKAHPGSGSRPSKSPTVQNSFRAKDELTLWEKKMADASKASRLNAMANEEAINDAVGVLLKATSSNATPNEKVINAHATVDTISDQAYTTEVYTEAFKATENATESVNNAPMEVIHALELIPNKVGDTPASSNIEMKDSGLVALNKVRLGEYTGDLPLSELATSMAGQHVESHSNNFIPKACDFDPKTKPCPNPEVLVESAPTLPNPTRPNGQLTHSETLIPATIASTAEYGPAGPLLHGQNVTEPLAPTADLCPLVNNPSFRASALELPAGHVAPLHGNSSYLPSDRMPTQLTSQDGAGNDSPNARRVAASGVGHLQSPVFVHHTLASQEAPKLVPDCNGTLPRPPSHYKSPSAHMHNDPTHSANLIAEANQAQPSGLGKTPTWVGIVRKQAGPAFCLKYFKPSPSINRGTVKIPKEVAEEGSQVWSSSLVGYFLKKLPYSLVKNSTTRLWSKLGLCDMLATDSGYYIFKFGDQSECDSVLEGGPWHIGGQPIILKQWQTGIRFEKEPQASIPLECGGS